MTAKVLLGVGLVAAALSFMGLGRPPFLDPPEGIHAQIAWEMLRRGDWITAHLNGVPYFDKPPLLYWLMAGSFALWGASEWAARLWSALPAVGVALLTAAIGLLLGSARVGLLAGLMVAANLGVFLFARIVKPDLLFVWLILLAFFGFILAYLRDDRRGLYLFAAGLALAVIAKDFMGALGPLIAVVVLLWLTRDIAPRRRWAPWGAVAVFVLIAVPWYLLVEASHRGFLWYTFVDQKLLAMTRQRVFPDEDVPLSALEFLGVTAAGFFPWILALPFGVWRALRGPWTTPEARIWLLLALWTVGVLGAFTLSPFKLPHYGLPAFPFMALLAARAWNDVVEKASGAPSRAALLIPALATFLAIGVFSLLTWRGVLTLSGDAIAAADVTMRNMEARGQQASVGFVEQFRPLWPTLGVIFGLGAVGTAAALLLRRPLVGLGALLAAMVAFLPLSVEGLTVFAKSRSVRAMSDAVTLRARPADILAHEGALENSASWLLGLDRPVQIVNGLESNLAFGSTFPEARGRFWDGQDLIRAWRGEQRVFLLTPTSPARSVVKDLPASQVHLVLEAGGRRLYSNRP